MQQIFDLDGVIVANSGTMLNNEEEEMWIPCQLAGQDPPVVRYSPLIVAGGSE